MSGKRLTIELPVDQYEFLKKEALTTDTTVVNIIRSLIDDARRQLHKDARKSYAADPFAQRQGSFKGPANLATDHDTYLYGKRSR